jgi:hypothetical protein
VISVRRHPACECAGGRLLTETPQNPDIDLIRSILASKEAEVSTKALTPAEDRKRTIQKSPR